jgi:FG-GAP repeat
VPALRYCGLTVNDAVGRELVAWLELRDQSLLVRVDDAGARYPLSIDPFIQQAKLTSSDGATQDRFGSSVAIAGNTIVVGALADDVGANVDQGSAYVFGGN